MLPAVLTIMVAQYYHSILTVIDIVLLHEVFHDIMYLPLEINHVPSLMMQHNPGPQSLD